LAAPIRISRAATVALALVIALALPAPAPARADDPDPWWGADKALHFSVSAGLAAAGYAGASLATDRRPVRLGAGAALALSAGIAKELLDGARGGDASWRDLTWDVVGTATGLLCALAIDWIWSAPAPPKPAPPEPAPTP
jgi:putative lipoprotein